MLGLTKCWHRQNVGVKKYSRQQNTRIGRNLALTKCWSMRGSISLLFGPAESTAADFSQTLLKFSYVSQKVLIPPHAVAKCAVAIASSADFLSSHRRMRYRKRRQKSEQGGGREREELGICVCCYLACTVPPPPFSLPCPALDLPHLPAAMVVWTGGTARRPPLATNTPFQQSETSVVDLCDGLYLEVMSM
jgi:hypothetical protein